MASNKKTKGDVTKKGYVDDKPVIIDKWDGSAVKNALDDAVKKVFTEKYNYVENFRLIDGRLTVCTLAVGIALFALAWDYLYPFPQSRPVLIFSVLSYFILMGILTLYTSLKEKGIFLLAIKKDPAGVDPDEVWHISSHIKRFDYIYNLRMVYTKGGASTRREVKLDKSVASWIDDNGLLVFETFEPEIVKLHDSILSEKKDK